MRGFDIDWLCPINKQEPLNEQLVSRWKVIPGVTGGPTWIDLADPSNGNHGTLTNLDASAWVGAGDRPDSNGSLSFPGGTGETRIETNFNLTKINTLSYWIFPRNVADFECPLMEVTVAGGGFYGKLLNGGNIEVWIAPDSSGTLKTALSANIWTYITLVRLGESITNGLKLYKNGVLAAEANSSTWVPPNIGLWFATQRNVLNREFDGLLDDISAWNNRALTADAVLEYYEDVVQGSPRTLNYIDYPLHVAAAGGLAAAKITALTARRAQPHVETWKSIPY